MLCGYRWHTCGTKLAVVWKWNGLAYVLYPLDEEGNVAKSHDCPGCGEYIYTSEFLMWPPDIIHDLAHPSGYQKKGANDETEDTSSL